MEFTAKQIAEYVGGKVEGDELASVNTFAKIEEGKKGAISFLSNMKYLHYIYDTESSIVLINEDVKLEKETKATLIRVCGKAAATLCFHETKESGHRLISLHTSFGKGGQGLLYRSFRGYRP